MTQNIFEPTLEVLSDPRFSADRLIAAGMTEREATAKGERFARCARTLIENGNPANARAVAAFVPGRIEVLGKHTDYCGGRSLLCTVERGMCFIGVRRDRANARFFALDLNASAEFEMRPDLEPTTRHWSNYPMTVARRIAGNFGAATGADVAMSSDLPPASGLSSSSAMIVGCFLIFATINRLESSEAYRSNIKTPLDLAGYLGCIENGQSFGTLAGDKGVGTFGGSQDHTAILCCKPGKLSVFSFCPVKHEREIDLPEEMRFVIADSEIVAEKTGDALEKYNAVSDRVRQILAIWNRNQPIPAACLRDAILSEKGAPDALRVLIVAASSGDPVSRELLIARLNQFINESTGFIPSAAAALAAGDWKAFGDAVNKSQAGAEKELHNQVPETISLQRALLASGALAASAFGAGFGGSVWGLFRGETAAALPGIARQFSTRPGCAAVRIAGA